MSVMNLYSPQLPVQCSGPVPILYTVTLWNVHVSAYHRSRFGQVLKLP